MTQDGPSPAANERHGSSSQDRPGDAEAPGGAGEAGRRAHEPTRPEDSNEKADDKVEIVDPDGDIAPRA